MTCSLCDNEATATTAIVKEESYQLCGRCMRLFMLSADKYSMRTFCRRVLTGLDV